MSDKGYAFREIVMQAALLLQVDGVMPAIAPPSGANWWQGLLYVLMLPVSGIVAHGIKLYMDRRAASDAAGGGLKKRLREMDELRKEGLLTDAEFAQQKAILLKTKPVEHEKQD